MSDLPGELLYLPSHEWLRIEDDGTAYVGITDHAQAAMGDLVYVEMPEVGADIAANEEAGVVESVKAASDIYAPVSGSIVAINNVLEDAPETVNTDPYGEGWMFKIKLADKSELSELMSPTEYQAQIDAEDE